MKQFLKKLLSTFLFCMICNMALDTYGKSEVTNVPIKIEGVPLIKQYPQLPTGCEATALTMVLNYHSVEVSKQEVANRLPKATLPYYNKGIKKGAHPNEGFIGNPYSSSSYGVYAEPILEVIESYLPGRSQDLRGKTLEELLDIVNEGRPVMIWATINMAKVSYTQSWYLENGELFWWPNNEHALVIVGYDEKWVYVNDPYSGKKKKFLRDVVSNRYATLGRQAVAILPEAKLLNLTIDEEKVILEENKTILMKQDKILLPLCYLEKLGLITYYKYIQGTCEWQVPHVQNTIKLEDKSGIGVGYLEDGTKIKIYYEIEKGVTRVNLQDLLQLQDLNYHVKENELQVELP